MDTSLEWLNSPPEHSEDEPVVLVDKFVAVAPPGCRRDFNPRQPRPSEAACPEARPSLAHRDEGVAV
eukprot:975102-Lingulodinium_polyedra.AAC.1